MSADDVPLVLLTGPLAPVAGVRALRTALGRLGPVLAPELSLSAAHPADLSRPALGVLAAVSATGADEAVLCGIGLGTMVALQVAATHPRRVSALVLCTAARPTSPAVRSVHQAVVGALPARALQVLPGGRKQAVEALDQVRTPDYAPMVPLVGSRTQVLFGEYDRLNGRASRRLARALPDATAVALPGSAPGWMWSHPDDFAHAVAAFLAR